MMPKERSHEEKLNLALWKDMLSLLSSQKKRILEALGIVFLQSLISLILPWLYRYAIDHFFDHSKGGMAIAIYVVFYLSVILLQSFLVYHFIDRSGQVEMNLAYETRQKAMEKLQRLPFSYYDRTDSGWIMARVTSDIARLSSILSWSFVDLIWGGMMMLLLMVMMLVVSPKVALTVLLILPIIFVVTFWFQKRMLENYRDLRQTNSELTAAYSEGISSAKTSKTLALEEKQYEDFGELAERMRFKASHAIFLSALYFPTVFFLSSLSEALLLSVGTKLVLQKGLTITTLILMTQYAGQFFQPLRNIAAILAQLQMAQASAERVMALLNEEEEIQDRPEVIEKYGDIFHPKFENFEEIKGKVEFRDVDFYYNPEEPVLENFNLIVEPKQTIALVGETGSGKSTIVNLLCRFYEPREGQVLIDGVDYRDRSMAWLRSQLGYVLQSPHLFSGSIKDNIRYGVPEAKDEEVIEVAKLIGAHDFIMELEDGYDTDVGEGGDRLSAGQKQLISFARALLVDPKIFVLDEATSSIDTETEQVIQEAVEKIMKDRTSFMIAHRLSTITNADRILVIDQGQVIEDGSHEELMAQKGHYYTLYMSQRYEQVEPEDL